MQVGGRDRVAIDLANGGRSGDRKRRAPGVAGPKGKEEPQLGESGGLPDSFTTPAGP